MSEETAMIEWLEGRLENGYGWYTEILDYNGNRTGDYDVKKKWTHASAEKNKGRLIIVIELENEIAARKARLNAGAAV